MKARAARHDQEKSADYHMRNNEWVVNKSNRGRQAQPRYRL